MSLIVTKDINGADVAINPTLIQGLTVATTTPAGVLVRTATENFVLPGTIASVSALLAGAGIGLPLSFTMTGATGVLTSRNAPAIADGLATSRSSAGVYLVTTTTPLGAVGTWQAIPTSLQNAAREITVTGLTTSGFQLNAFDAATPGAADSDLQCLIVFVGP